MAAKANVKKVSSDAGPSMEDIVEILRERIVRQDLAPGAKLNEVALAQEFNVSRPRVREAFGVLEDRKLIERIPNRGAVVARLEPDEILALFEVREVLEALSVRLATEKSDPSSWQELIERFGKPAEEALERGELDYYVNSIHLFRETALAAAANPVLASQMASIFDRTKVLIRRLALVPGRAQLG